MRKRIFVLICIFLLVIPSVGADIYEVGATSLKMVDVEFAQEPSYTLGGTIDMRSTGYGDLDDDENEQLDPEVSDMDTPGVSTTPIGNIPWWMICVLVIGMVRNILIQRNESE